MSDIKKTRLLCEMYKLQQDSIAIEDLKIPSLTNDLKSKTLMKLIGYYRDKKIPIDIIVLFYDLEKRPFSLFKLIFQLMKMSKDLEDKIEDISNKNKLQPIKHEFNFTSYLPNNDFKTEIKIDIAYGQKQKEIIQRINKKIALNQDTIVLIIDYKCRDKECATSFKEEYDNFIKESIQKLEELIDDSKMSSFLKILKIESFVVESNLISKFHFNYLALQPVLIRFRKYIETIVGENNNINFSLLFKSLYEFSVIKNPLKFLATFLQVPKSTFNLQFSYDYIFSLIKTWLQYQKDQKKKDLGASYVQDKSYKNLLSFQSLLIFILGNQGIKLNINYKENQAQINEQYIKNHIKKYLSVFKMHLKIIQEAYIFAKSKNLHSFISNVSELQDIIEQLYQYALCNINVVFNFPIFIIDFNLKSQGVKEFAEQFLEF